MRLHLNGWRHVRQIFCILKLASKEAADDRPPHEAADHQKKVRRETDNFWNLDAQVSRMQFSLPCSFISNASASGSFSHPADGL